MRFQGWTGKKREKPHGLLQMENFPFPEIILVLVGMRSGRKSWIQWGTHRLSSSTPKFPGLGWERGCGRREWHHSEPSPAGRAPQHSQGTTGSHHGRFLLQREHIPDCGYFQKLERLEFLCSPRWALSAFPEKPPGPEILGAVGRRCSEAIGAGRSRWSWLPLPSHQFPGNSAPWEQDPTPPSSPSSQSLQPFPSMWDPFSSCHRNARRGQKNSPQLLSRGFSSLPLSSFPTFSTSSRPADGPCFPGTFPFPNIRDFWPSPRCTACPSKPGYRTPLTSLLLLLLLGIDRDPCRAPPGRMFWLGIFYGKQGETEPRGGSWHLLSSAK